MTALNFVKDALAVYRLTKLVIDDELTSELREMAFAKLDVARASDRIPKRLIDKTEYWLTCPWCASWWAAVALFALRRYSPGTYRLVSETLAMSAVTGVIYSNHHRLLG